MVFGGGAFGRCLGHEGRAPLNEISALVKETPESFLTTPPREHTARRWPSMNQKAALTRHQIHWHLDLGLPAPQL